MAIDLFETRTLLPALEQAKRPTTFLIKTFFPRMDPSDTNTVSIDTVKGKRRVAPYVSPLHEGRLVERQGFQTDHYEPPYVKPKMQTTAGDLLNRRPGEVIYGSQTPQQRAQAQIGKDMAELDEEITRREEQQAADVLDDGKITVQGDGIDKVIDFGLPDSHIIGTGDITTWGNSSAKPIDQLKGWRRDKIIKDSGVNPNVALMGSDAVDTFLGHSSVQNKLDVRRIDQGEINPQALPEGVTYYGFIKELGCDIYSYDAWYLDNDGVEHAMIDPKKVIMGSTNARAGIQYAAIQDVQAGNFAVQRFPKSWIQEDPSVRYLMVQSAPLACMFQPDAFLVATVLT